VYDIMISDEKPMLALGAPCYCVWAEIREFPFDEAKLRKWHATVKILASPTKFEFVPPALQELEREMFEALHTKTKYSDSVSFSRLEMTQYRVPKKLFVIRVGSMLKDLFFLVSEKALLRLSPKEYGMDVDGEPRL